MQRTILHIRDLEDDRSKRAFEQFIPLYAREFTNPDESEDPAQWVERLSRAFPVPPQPRTNILVFGEQLDAAAGMQVLGGLVCEYYQESCCGLITYLLVDPRHRKEGIAKQLIAKAGAVLQEEAERDGKQLLSVFAEAQHFEAVSDSAKRSVAATRLAIFSRLGAKWIDIPYVQPALDEFGKQPSRDLLFISFPGLKEAPPILSRRVIEASIPAAVVICFLDEFYRALGVPTPGEDPHFQSIKSALQKLTACYGEGRVPYKELPTVEQPNFRFSRIAVCLHLVTVECEGGESFPAEEEVTAVSEMCHARVRKNYPYQPGEAGISLVDGTEADEYCPNYTSFEMDLLSYRFQVKPPLSSRCVWERPRRVVLHFPNKIEYLSEGRVVPLYCPDPQLQASVLLSYTRFRDTQLRIWHLVFRPLEGSSFTEYDVIKLISLYSDKQEKINIYDERSKRLLDEITFSPEGERGGLSFTAFTHRLSEGCLLDASPRSGTIEIDPDETLGRPENRLPWRELFESLHGAAEDDPASIADLERLLKDRKTSRAVKACCGVIQGIFDFERMSLSELQDVLIPNVPSGPDIIRLHRGTLTSLDVEDELLEECKSTIGISPYLLIPHAVMLHNEFLVDCAEEMIDALARERDIRKLEEANETVERFLKRQYLPNLFQYATERDIYRIGFQHRGAAEKLDLVRDKHSELKARLELAKELRGSRRNFYITLLLGGLSTTALFEMFDFFSKPENVHMFSVWPPGLTAIIFYGFLAVLLLVFLLAYPRVR